MIYAGHLLSEISPSTFPSFLAKSQQQSCFLCPYVPAYSSYLSSIPKCFSMVSSSSPAPWRPWPLQCWCIGWWAIRQACFRVQIRCMAALCASSKSCCILALLLLDLLTVNPEIIFILLRREEHWLQSWSVHDTKIAVQMNSLITLFIDRLLWSFFGVLFLFFFS